LLSLSNGHERVLRNEALRSLRGGQFTPDERSSLELIGRADPESEEMVKRVLHPGAGASRPAAEDIEGWLKLLDGPDGPLQGDAAAGERIFFHDKSAACSRCHQIYGRGARIGPELATTAATLTRRRLVESILRPSKEIAPQFASWLIVTTSGKTLTGMLVHEEATGEQTYADPNGALVVLKPGEIESRRSQSISIMPDGLPQLMSVQEFRDLLAFLQAAREESN
jgi:putative heme-binding domain-containing protein